MFLELKYTQMYTYTYAHSNTRNYILQKQMYTHTLTPTQKCISCDWSDD